MADTADDRLVEIVNDFILNTCQRRRRVNVDDMMVIRETARLVSVAFDDITSLSTGSVAEFYIEPMLSCIGGIDVMVHLNNHLAIAQGHPPPTQLPAEFHGSVYVFEIIDSEFPGYVYLVFCYLLTEITDDGKYNAVQCRRQYVRYDLALICGGNMQGPAFVAKYPNYESPIRLVSSSDMVWFVRCQWWPTQAAAWSTRHRNYGWPDSATVDRVVGNGCDVVFVTHHLCRQDEGMGKYQWRLSFSRAEIILINSWMPVQQIVYHMLRSFMKTERLTDITDSTGSKILSNYNIKTLMLWACELKARSWWIDELNVVIS